MSHFNQDLQRALAGADSVELQAVQACLLDRYVEANEEALLPADQHQGDGMTVAMSSEYAKGFASGLNEALSLIQEAMAPAASESD